MVLRRAPRTARIDPTEATSLVLCESMAMAQALILSLGLEQARAVRWLATCARAFDPPVAATELGILVASDVGLIVSAVRNLKRHSQQIKVIAVGVPNQEKAILRVFTAGADGVVLAEESLDQLAEATRNVLAGNFWVPPHVVRPFFSRLFHLRSVGNGRHQPVGRLSGREVEILSHLVRGDSNKRIAVELHLETQTIKNHVTSILRKLGVRNRFDAARVGAEHIRNDPTALEKQTA